MLTLTELKSILREHNIHPSKRLGQNFLIDRNIKDKIINAIHSVDTILEIGPGLGALTEDLCKIAKRVIAIEKDKRLYNFLYPLTLTLSPEGRGKGEGEKLELIKGDFLKCEFKNLPSKVTVVGNLPYYISTPILEHLIENRAYISSIYITLQSEVAERIVAKSCAKDYSSLSCYIQFYGEPKILFKIPKTAFFPAPKVDSCFLRIDLRKQPEKDIDEKLLFKIIRSAFEKRRKTVLSSLYSSGIFSSKEEIYKALQKARISQERRPETISIEEFIILANNLG